MTPEIINNLKNVLKDIENEKGKVDAFVLLLPEDSLKWDLLIASKWVQDNPVFSIDYVNRIIFKYFSYAEFIKISRIIPLNKNEKSYNNFIYAIKETMKVEGKGIIHLRNVEFFGIYIREAYIFRS